MKPNKDKPPKLISVAALITNARAIQFCSCADCSGEEIAPIRVSMQEQVRNLATAQLRSMLMLLPHDAYSYDT